jgi:hypothetical protein
LAQILARESRCDNVARGESVDVGDVADERSVFESFLEHGLRGAPDLREEDGSMASLVEAKFDTSDAGEQSDDG